MSDRLTRALDDGALALPQAGRVLALRMPGDADLSSLPLDRLVAVTGFRPDHEALSGRGVTVAPAAEGPFAGAIVFLPRSRALAQDLIAAAMGILPAGAPLIVDGAKTDGIDALWRACRKRFDVGDTVTRGHGRAFALACPSVAPDDWVARPVEVDGFVTTAGVFSADGVDPGSALLAARLDGVAGRVCDLGAGWGYLSHAVLARPAVTQVDLVEAERAALDCARLNVADDRAAFHWADARRFEGGPYDWIVSNPPFHTGRQADPDLGRAFIAAAARLLSPRGRLRLVANRQLPYEAALSDAFAETLVLEERDGYKVLDAARPRRGRI